MSYSLGLDGHFHVKSLSLLQRVILLLLVGQIIGLVEVLLVLLQSNLEVQSLRSLLETNTDVGLLSVLLNSHDEITRRIQHRLNHRGTIVTNHSGGEDLLLVVHQLDVAGLSAENHVQSSEPDLIRPTGSTVTHTSVSGGNLVNVASADVAEVLLENIVFVGHGY